MGRKASQGPDLGGEALRERARQVAEEKIATCRRIGSDIAESFRQRYLGGDNAEDAETEEPDRKA